MPLDSTNWKQDTETKPDLSKPSLEGLSWLLRHLPVTHKWDFRNVGGPKLRGCGSAGCALGLALATWPGARIEFPNVPVEVQNRFFFYGQYPVADRLVTPQMVADRIDEFLRSRKTDAYLAETRK